MARQRSAQRHSEILAAATRVIAREGLRASTAAIAKQANVSNGSLFLYFGTKAEMLNELYLALKREAADAALQDLPVGVEVREQVRHMWNRWLEWATTDPDKRRALACLQVADEITEDSRLIALLAQQGMVELFERSRSHAPLAHVDAYFVLAMAGAIADTTMDAMIREPSHAQARSAVAFEAVWRVLAG